MRLEQGKASLASSVLAREPESSLFATTASAVRLEEGETVSLASSALAREPESSLFATSASGQPELVGPPQVETSTTVQALASGLPEGGLLDAATTAQVLQPVHGPSWARLAAAPAPAQGGG